MQLLHLDVWCISFNKLRRRQNGRHIPDDTFKCIFLNENVWISIKISLKFVTKDPIKIKVKVWQTLLTYKNNWLSLQQLTVIQSRGCLSNKLVNMTLAIAFTKIVSIKMQLLLIMLITYGAHEMC